MSNNQRPSPEDNLPEQKSSDYELKVFVPSKLDDYGLKPTCFRVYCHIARRDGDEGAWSSVANIARVCRIHPQTARKALRFLTARAFLTRKRRPGQTTIYRLTPQSAWQPPD
jgi:DNA-binding MarR family transcriptional regulator